MRKNEHPSCGCKACKRSAGSAYAQFIHRATNRKIRHETKRQLRSGPLDFVGLIVSTPYVD